MILIAAASLMADVSVYVNFSCRFSGSPVAENHDTTNARINRSND
jgi:hypothetical protein